MKYKRPRNLPYNKDCKKLKTFTIKNIWSDSRLMDFSIESIVKSVELIIIFKKITSLFERKSYQEKDEKIIHSWISFAFVAKTKVFFICVVFFVFAILWNYFLYFSHSVCIFIFSMTFCPSNICSSIILGRTYQPFLCNKFQWFI